MGMTATVNEPLGLWLAWHNAQYTIHKTQSLLHGDIYVWISCRDESLIFSWVGQTPLETFDPTASFIL